MRRRDFLYGVVSGAGALALVRLSLASPAPIARDAFKRIERLHDVELGVAAIDTGDGQTLAHRGDQRFALLSTFKLVLAGAILARVDAGQEHLATRIVVRPEDVLEWAPVTRRHVGPPGLTIAALCHAAITVSDNTAANLLLRRVGGPTGLSRYMRGLGDDVSRLDRTEPTLNDVRPGDPRDTTTPAAMLADARKLLLGDVLSANSRQQLADWLRATTTGSKRLAAGIPDDWQHGDKTGSNAMASNDVAIFWPRNRAPILVAAYCRGSTLTRREAALAATGRLVVAAFTKP